MLSATAARALRTCQAPARSAVVLVSLTILLVRLLSRSRLWVAGAPAAERCWRTGKSSALRSHPYLVDFEVGRSVRDTVRQLQ